METQTGKPEKITTMPKKQFFSYLLNAFAAGFVSGVIFALVV